MKKQAFYEIKRNQPLARDIFLMTLVGPMNFEPRPGQFINIKIDGFYLRRPISICSFDEDSMDIIYKIAGNGTDALSKMSPGQKLDVLCGLGNGFDLSLAEGRRIVLVGGGVGIPPLYGLGKALKAAGAEFTAVLGWQTHDQAFFIDEFSAICPTRVVTNDGGIGKKGVVTDILREISYDYYFTCGPEPMLKAVYDLGGNGQLSFEARMGCGFGACMGCSRKTLGGGSKRICMQGPVLRSDEVLFSWINLE
ncbi:MAG: dihydroorotate dehydrogenase electron transfer subunit [Oscillospiraceae bacterium]|jgi:dihydroorotate dehydrogenase electron transfer subunit|nr:dihydroorotate dehydrogenase electron transfer subunit [Oscillospiraceae bacterium]